MAKSNLPATERVVSYVAPTAGYWVIPTENGDLALSQTLLPRMRQEQAAKYSNSEGFSPLSLPEHFELFKGLYELRKKGGAVENARQFLQDSIRQQQPLALTRLFYQPQGKTRIVHNYGAESSIEKQADLIGSNGNVLEVLTPETSLALTGKTPEEVAELMQYINHTPTYIWRLNSRPEFLDERVAGFYACSIWAGLNCDRVPRNSDPSLGVKFSPQGAFENLEAQFKH